MDILQETDTFHPLLLNIGYAIHHSDWNWTEVNSPFFRIYYVTKGMAEVTLPDRTITLSPHHLYIIPAFTCHNCHCEGDFEHYYLQFTKTILPPPVSWKIWTSPLKFRPAHWIWS